VQDATVYLFVRDRLVLACAYGVPVSRKNRHPNFRYPRATNPRIFGTPIPIFLELDLRDPTRDLHPENWNPRERTTLHRKNTPARPGGCHSHRLYSHSCDRTQSTVNGQTIRISAVIDMVQSTVKVESVNVQIPVRNGPD